MKKIFVVFIIFIALVIPVRAFANFDSIETKPSDYNIGITYLQALQENKPMVVLFYADWCTACLKFMPQYKIISNLYKTNYSFVMLNAEAPANRALVEDIALTGFPTLYIIDPKYDNRVLLNNAIYWNLKKLRTELDRYFRIRNLLDLR